MIVGDLVAIGGSKFQGCASSRRHLSQLKRREEKLYKHIGHYLAELEAADKSEGELVIDHTAIKPALVLLEIKRKDNRSCQAPMKSMGEQFNTCDARIMRRPMGHDCNQSEAGDQRPGRSTSDDVDRLKSLKQTTRTSRGACLKPNQRVFTQSEAALFASGRGASAA